MLMLLGMFFLPPAGHAQSPEPANLQQLFQELDQKIATLENVSAQFHNQKLTQSIQTIREHRRKAVEFSRKKQYRLARQELRLALRLSDTVLKKSMVAIVRNYQAPLEEMRRRAENQIHRRYNADADRLLKRAKQVHRNAVRAFQSRNFAKATELYKVEKSLLENCLKILEQNAPEKYARIQSDRQNFLELKRQAEKSLQGTRGTLSASLYNQAMDQARKAEQAYKKGDLKKANLYYQWSTRLLLRVINLTEGGNYALSQQAKDNLQLTRQVLKGMIQEYSGQMKPMTRKLLEQVQKLLIDAQMDYDRKNYSSAIQKTDVARKILSRLQSSPIQKNGSYQAQLKENIRALRQLLESIPKDGNQSTRGQTLLKLSNEFLGKSQRELSKGNYKTSAAFLLVANRLALQFKRMAQNLAAGSSVSEAAVRSKYKNFQTKMNLLSSRDFGSNSTKQLFLTILKGLQKKIERAIQDQNWAEANEYLVVAESILRQF
ncbi:MAG: hypothetical protein GXO76_05285 [Calditrichaeota bacterium]|nr:hypothetical protein [Calditrichota bacterium]